MLRTDFSAMSCSIARTHSVLGEAWVPLILRDLLVGIRRFDALLEDLGVSRKVLSERLAQLAELEIVERREYTSRPPRHEYALTPKGIELCGALLVMAAWGDRWMAGPEGPPATFTHRACGKETTFAVQCSACGDAMTADEVLIGDPR